jgi:hypothetical protein
MKDMSSQLTNLKNYLDSALEGSPAHRAKISDLEAAVKKGAYQADAYAVSGCIIQHRVEFGSTAYLPLTPRRARSPR